MTEKEAGYIAPEAVVTVLKMASIRVEYGDDINIDVDDTSGDLDIQYGGVIVPRKYIPAFIYAIKAVANIE